MTRLTIFDFGVALPAVKTSVSDDQKNVVIKVVDCVFPNVNKARYYRYINGLDKVETSKSIRYATHFTPEEATLIRKQLYELDLISTEQILAIEYLKEVN